MKQISKNIAMYILAALVSISIIVLIGILIYKPIPEQNRDVLNMVIGALVTCFIMIMNYFFGTSKSSAEKTEMLNQKYRQNEP